MLAPVHTRRRGFTLIELIVVMSIIILLAALTAAYWPDIQSARSVNNATDQTSQWLLTAKQRAKRDGLATGVRFLVAGNNLAGQVQYIQQLDDLSGGMCNGTVAGNNTITFTGIDFIGGAATAGQADQALVQAGDYFEQFGGGTIYQIQTVTQSGANNPSITVLPVPTVTTGSTLTYRILRAPRPLAGEDVLTLPNTMTVDLTNTLNLSSLNVPARTVNGVTFFEILFSPTGSVIGQGTSGGKIILWVRDSSQPATATDFAALVTIQIRSGFIGASRVAPGADPYLFTEDGRSSGM